MERQKKFAETMKLNPEAQVYATIKLPEIMSGWDDKDFRKDFKMKKLQFK